LQEPLLTQFADEDLRVPDLCLSEGAKHQSHWKYLAKKKKNYPVLFNQLRGSRACARVNERDPFGLWCENP
jgi:hypothetical protein